MTNKFKLIGYKNIFENFIQLYDKNCLPNKILLTGNKGIGKSLFVKHFLSYIYSINDINKYNFQDFEINNLSKSSILIENNSQTSNLWNRTNQILEEYDLPNRFSKLNTNHLPSLKSLVDNLNNDKKCLSLGNRFILCKKIGEAGVEKINDEKLIYNAFNVLFS